MEKTQATTQPKTDLKPRPPVVTIMGHVDHGKTSLLDAIRGSKVAEKEHGGITQHISSYQIVHNGRKITFIDTPGHEVFYEMRSRGANVTDIVVLVVAADDGVMPQTKESIKIIQQAKSPFIVAANKMDSPGANLDKVKQQLAENEVLVEGYGGDVPLVPVSAKTKLGLDDLLEVIQLVADLEELKDTGELEGIVVEARNDQYKGPTALVLVKNGTLSTGDQVYSGKQKFKVKALLSTLGEKVTKVGASFPVEVLGFSDVPKVGDFLSAIDMSSDTAAAAVAKKKLTTADLYAKEKVKFNVVLKADVQGSLEAVEAALKRLEGENELEVIKVSTGEISDSDITLASSTGALVVGFNVAPTPSARRLAVTENVTIRTFKIIYELLDTIEKHELFGVKEIEILARAEVLRVFDTPAGKVTGISLTEGTIHQNDTVKIIRGGSRVVGTTKVASIRHQAEILQEAVSGKEYGFLFSPPLNTQVGDAIEMEETQS